MGNPLHFSLELPQRCLQLIDDLWPHAEMIRPKVDPELGPLTTTFLLSMSVPIVTLPVERIERHKEAKDQGYADDRHLDAHMTAAIDDVLGGHKLKRAPFFVPDAWSFATRDADSRFNIADLIPEDLADELATKAATTRAADMPTSQWCSTLRNALAHGGIAYLDEAGRSRRFSPVKMYGFISGRYEEEDDDNNKKLVGLNILRISEANYRAFLREWVAWLQNLKFKELAPAYLENEALLVALKRVSHDRPAVSR